jgi:serine/threonine protein kinase
MFGLRDGEPVGATGTRTGTTDTVGRWVAATEGADQPPDVSGRLIHGRYRLIAELGVGGMGVTYRAWDTKAGIPVVVKMPRREVRSDSEAMQRFAREIDAMLAVPHEHIVPITDHGDDDGCPFVVMRFLPGGSLADYRRRDEAGNAIRNPPGMLHFWLPGVAAALDHIHGKGMLHRDVKPGNIFLDGFLKPYLGDFGIAKVVDESGGLVKEQTLTATKMAVGTPEYMAPELFKPRSKPDGQADQYALAVTVYEMLAGEKPFKGERAHIIVEHSALPVPPLSAKVPGLPQSLCMAVERGLAKKSEERFATCRAFAEAVLAELAVLPPEADTVRLLCPSCKNILKLPQRAAGRTGKCPRCHAAIDVAADLGSLWLDSEQRGWERATTAGTNKPSSQQKRLDEYAWRPSYWVIVGLAALGIVPAFVLMMIITDIILGFGSGASHIAKTKETEGLAAGTEKARNELGDAQKALSLAKDSTNRLLAENVALNNALKEAVAASLARDEENATQIVGRALAGTRSVYLCDYTNTLAKLTLSEAEALAQQRGLLALDGLTEISDAQAEALAKHKGALSLNKLVVLSDAQGKALANHSGQLQLNGLSTLTDSQVEALAKHEGWLELNGLTALSVRQASACVSVPGWRISLDGVSTLSEEAAKALRGYQRDISFNGLAGLSDTLADALSNHYGSLSLNGVTELSDQAAESLARHGGFRDVNNRKERYGELSLNGLAELSDKQAEAFAKHEGLVLELNGLKQLTDRQAELLARHEGALSLNGLAELTDKQAELLATHHGDLSLNGLKTLKITRAQGLAKHAATLSLNGLTWISVECANALARQQGRLYLDGLTSLTDRHADALWRHEGYMLSLNGLVHLSEWQAESLAHHKRGLSLNGLITITDTQAEALAKQEGRLWLNGLTTLSDAQAERLGNRPTFFDRRYRRDELQLRGLAALTDSQAVSLSRYGGELDLRGLRALSDAQAAAFASYRGEGLTLWGLTSLSDNAMKALQSNAKVWLPTTFRR